MSRDNSQLNKKGYFLIVFLLVNSLTWFLMIRRSIYIVLQGFDVTPQSYVILWGIYDLAIIISGLIGAILSNKIERFTLFYLWIIIGIVFSVPFLFLSSLSSYFLAAILFGGILFGFGFGMPSCLAYFAEQTFIENRGYTGGLIIFLTNAAAPPIILIKDVTLCAIIAIIWRIMGFIMLFLMKPEKGNTVKKEKQQVSFRLILNKNFILYFIPWLMFSLIYGFQRVILEQNIETGFFDFLRTLGAIFGTLSAIISGSISDRIGRKHVIIYGFISLGVAYAAVGIVPNNLFSLYLYSVIDGIAWGIFMLMFVLVLWGDLSHLDVKPAEKYYALGSIPFFFGDFIGFLFSSYIWMPLSAAFSVASFFLFLAVLPLMYAPETLPEKLIRRRELRKYVEKAKKIREKYEAKD